jgi:hypothetical protein
MPPSFGGGGGKGMEPEPTRLRQIALVVGDLGEARRVLVRFYSFYFGLFLDGDGGLIFWFLVFSRLFSILSFKCSAIGIEISGDEGCLGRDIWILRE